jgi:hypothetical protein
MEIIMNISITPSARDELGKVLRGSEFIKPALRVVFSGYG